MTDSGEERDDVSLVYVVGRVNQGIRREMRQHLGQWELGVPEFTALSILRRRPGLSNAQLARRSMVTPQTMIEILAGLEARGLVQRAGDPDHGRILRAQLTRAGEQLLDSTEPGIEQIQEKILAGVPKRQQQIVMDVMLRAMERLRPGLDN
jgi:DNA-binding MarR family transcriptional regulator